MATITTVTSNNFSFPGPIGTKRRRMRSGGNVSTLNNNGPQFDDDDDSNHNSVEDGSSAAPNAKCKATTIPIFLKKTYKMIDTCDPSIASWTPDGEMFVVKDPDTFATEVIPQYFDHNKFSSFARQLNFYGFRKMQSKPIRNSDFDAGTAKHVTFFNENFKRGRCDLLKNIQRSTRGGGTTNQQDHQREVQILKEQVSSLELKVETMQNEMEERMRRLELDMLARMEQMMLALQQQQAQNTSTQFQANSVGSSSTNSNNQSNAGVPMGNPNPTAQQHSWDANAFPRTHSIGAAAGNQNNSVTFQQPAPVQRSNNSGPTLPPHPKQKQLPMNGVLPPSVTGGGGPNNRLNSLRGISALTRGLSSLSRGASVESSASAVLMRNSWEDKFFSMLMLGENGEPIQNGGMPMANGNGNEGMNGMVGPTPLGPGASGPNNMMNSMGAHLAASDQSLSMGMHHNGSHNMHQNHDLSPVSDVGM